MLLRHSLNDEPGASRIERAVESALRARRAYGRRPPPVGRRYRRRSSRPSSPRRCERRKNRFGAGARGGDRLLGTGGSADQCGSRAHGRHQRRVDRAPYGHQAAPQSRRGGEYASTVAIGAIDDLFTHNPQYTIRDVDYIIAGSSTADYAFPSLSAMVQAHYQMPLTVGAVDISTACAGFTYGLNLAAGLVASGQAERVLVVVGDALTRTIDYTDRATCVLFGDGGGAALVERSEQPGIFGMSAGSDGTAGAFLYRTAVRQEVNGIIDTSRLVRQEGASIYRWVMEHIPEAIEIVLSRAGLSLHDIDWFVPHSANARMIEALDHRPAVSDRTHAAKHRRVRQYVRREHSVSADARGPRRTRASRRQTAVDGFRRRLGAGGQRPPLVRQLGYRPATARKSYVRAAPVA